MAENNTLRTLQTRLAQRSQLEEDLQALLAQQASQEKSPEGAGTKEAV